MSHWATEFYAGKTAVVIGGTSGIGHAIARAFRDAGAVVHATGATEAEVSAATGEGIAFTRLDVRDMAAVESWLAAGITRVILGTAALTNPEFVKQAARAFPGRIVVGADAKGGKIATQGWADVSDLTPVDLGKRFEDAGVAAILFTDIDGDGLLKGVNVTATAHSSLGLSGSGTIRTRSPTLRSRAMIR